MDQPPFLVPALINQIYYPTILLDSGYLSYGLIDSKFASKYGTERIKIPPRTMEGFNDVINDRCNEVTVI